MQEADRSPDDQQYRDTEVAQRDSHMQEQVLAKKQGKHAFHAFFCVE